MIIHFSSELGKTLFSVPDFNYYVVNYASPSRLEIFRRKNGDFKQKENVVFGFCRDYFCNADDFCLQGEIINSGGE